MDIETVIAKMMAQVEEARLSHMTQVFGWVFDVQPPIVFVTLRYRRFPERQYLLWVSFDEFPRRAPSYQFVDKDSKQIVKSAWPPGVGHEDPPIGICTLGTRECHERIHPNDAQYVWNPERHTFLSTLFEIQKIMEKGIN